MDFAKIYIKCNLKENLGSHAYWIKDSEKIDLGCNMWHHNCIVDIPYEFLDVKTIENFKKDFNLKDLNELKNNKDFQEESGPEYEELKSLVFKNGWISVRSNDILNYITCYDLENPKYRKLVVNALLDHSNCFSYNIVVGDFLGNKAISTTHGISGLIKKLKK